MDKTLICPVCKNQLRESVYYCTKCGAKLQMFKSHKSEHNSSLTRQDIYAVEFARQKAAEDIQGIPDSVKNDIREIIANGIEQKKSSIKVASELFDKFGKYNRDWRLIAITESTRAAGEGYMRRLLEDQKIMNKKETLLLGQSAVDACPWCKKHIHGKVFNLIPLEQAPINDLNSPLWDTALWQGKNNIGRRYTKTKLVVHSDGTRVFVPRQNSEIAKPTFAAHPNCRCWYTLYLRKFKIGTDGFLE